jgi:hypothetical protein
MNANNRVDQEKHESVECLLNGSPVCILNGHEFEKSDEKSLLQQLSDYFNEIGNVVNTAFGEVIVDRKAIKTDIHHGMSRVKAITFAAVKPTLERGIVLLPLEHYNTHNKKQKTGMIAAPVQICNEKYICVVVVIENLTTDRLYVHEAFITKKLLDDVAVTNAVHGAETPVTQHQGEVAKILKKLIKDI